MTPPSAPGRPPRGKRPGRAWRTVLVAALALCLGAAGAVRVFGNAATLPVRSPECTADSGEGAHSLTPEQTGNASTIASVAIGRELPARAVTIALATAMQESKLSNIDYGHLDSLGLFQQRPSQGWGTKKQVTDPVYASNAFYDRLVKVHGYRTLPITEAAQAVQRSGFPDAYAQHEGMARAFSSALTGNEPAGLSCTLRPVTDGSGAGDSSAGAKDLLSSLASDAGLPGVRAERRTLPPAEGTSTAGDPLVELRLDPKGGDAQPLWALAAWVMAHAEEFRVVSISADGKQWTRKESDKGWRPIGDLEPETRKPAPSGGVLALIG